MVRSGLCDYSDACILVKWITIVPSTEKTAALDNRRL